MISQNFWRWSAIAAVMALLGVLLVPHPHVAAETPPVTVEIDPAQRFQTMNGWEVTLNLSDNPAAPEWTRFHDQALDQAINDVGINRVRLEIRSGAETSSDWNRRYINGEISHKQWEPYRYPVENDNDDPNLINWAGFSFEELDWHVEEHVLPMMAKSEARGEKLWINICYVAFIDSRKAHRDPDEYAEFVLATYLHLQEKYGIVPDSWEVILEPDLRPRMWNGKMIGKAIVATAARLEDAGFEPAFVVPSVTNMRNATLYLNHIAKVPGAMDHVIEFSYHRYKGANERNLRDIAKLAAKHEIGPSMLELWFGRANAEVLYQDLVTGNNVAWQGRALMGLFDSPRGNRSPEVLRLRKDIRDNRQYFRDVRLGATRIHAESEDEATVRPVAFQNADGSITVIINTQQATALELRALPPGAYRAYLVADEQYRDIEEALIVDDSGRLEIDMPGRGLITVTSYQP